MHNAIINRLSISCSHDYQCNSRSYKALIVSAKPKTYTTLRKTNAVVYMLYSRRPLSTTANQQLAVSTGIIATYLGNLAPRLHAVVHELCVRAPIGAIVI